MYQAKVDTLTNVVGTEAIVNIPIEADSTFTWERTTYTLTQNASQTRDTVVIPDVSVQITDTGSGRNLQQLPVNINDLAGSAQLPFVLPVERVFAARSTIQVTFTQNQAVDVYQGLSLVFHGYKTWLLS